MNASNSTQQIPLSSRSTSSLLVTCVAALFAAILLLLVAVERTDAQAQVEVSAWGDNAFGQLGDGTATQRNTPTQLSGFSGVQTIAGGFYHSLALKSDGTLWAWGRNNYGQLGTGTTTDSNTPVKVSEVSGLSGVQAIDGGFYHSLALKSDGTLWAWGYNKYSQLGAGTTTDSSTPVKVIGLSDVKAISSGGHHGLALKNDDTLWAWGKNEFGALGDGTTTNSSTPVQVKGPNGEGFLSDVQASAGGQLYSLALKKDGTVWAWGRNNWGQLGDGTTTQRNTPVQVRGLSDVKAIGAGHYHSLALTRAGTL
jgi:alpha-tubulin suppressor-like RCC1 family protein